MEVFTAPLLCCFVYKFALLVAFLSLHMLGAVGIAWGLAGQTFWGSWLQMNIQHPWALLEDADSQIAGSLYRTTSAKAMGRVCSSASPQCLLAVFLRGFWYWSGRVKAAAEELKI